MSFGSDAQRDILVQDGLEVTTEAMELGVHFDSEGARVEAVAVNVSGEWMLEGEELLRLRQLSLVLEADNVGSLEVALGMFVGIAARANLVVEFRRLKGANLEMLKCENGFYFLHIYRSKTPCSANLPKMCRKREC